MAAWNEDVLSVLLRGTRLQRSSSRQGDAPGTNKPPPASSVSVSSASSSISKISTPVFQLKARQNRKPTPSDDAGQDASTRRHASHPHSNAGQLPDFFALGEKLLGCTSPSKAGREGGKTGKSGGGESLVTGGTQLAPSSSGRASPSNSARTSLQQKIQLNGKDVMSSSHADEKGVHTPDPEEEQEPRQEHEQDLSLSSLRRKHKIYVKAGSEALIPPPFLSFSDQIPLAFLQGDVTNTSPRSRAGSSSSSALPPVSIHLSEAPRQEDHEGRKESQASASSSPEVHSEDKRLETTGEAGADKKRKKKKKKTKDANSPQGSQEGSFLGPSSAASSSSSSLNSADANKPPSFLLSKGKTSVRQLPLWLQERMKSIGIDRPTPIQMQAIPLLLQGSHLLATAPTGSGKTFAFLLPLLSLLKKPGKEYARLLIVCPSRELARQTQREFDRIAGPRGFRCRLLDEKNVGACDQISSFKRLDAAVSTPLRLVQFLRDGRVTLSQCRHLVLDEADKLLDLGFAPQLDEIIAGCTSSRLQVCLFSATLPPAVLDLADSVLHSPVHISIGAPNAAAASIEQELLFCTNEEGKLLALRQLHLTGKFVPPVLIFVQSKERAKQLYCELVYDGLFVECIHADKTKKQRDDIVDAFRRGQIWVLICTDVMARGVDFKNVELVINYDFPQSAAVYIHRIGRTGRAGRQGRAVTFYTTADIPYLRSVVGVMQQTSTCEVPEWLQRMTKLTAKQKKELQRHAPRRKPILTTPAIDVRKAKRRQQAVAASRAKRRKTCAVENTQ